MNIVDVIIILILVSGGVLGFKRGFTSELVQSLGFFVAVIIAFLLKNPVSVFLYEHLPFFKFGGIIKGVTALNIALYEVFAFLIVLTIIMFALRLLVHFTNIFEGFLKVTIVFAPISKIGGMIIGILESFVWVFLILYVATLPMFNIKEINESKYKDKILNNVPILSGFASKTVDVFNDFSKLKDKYEISPNAKEFNKETLDLFLKYDVISVDSVEVLVKQDKIKVDNIDEILNKYRK